MRLSEAIKLGSMLKTQCVNAMWSLDGNSVDALGAASEAVGIYGMPPGAGGDCLRAAVRALAVHFPVLQQGWLFCPVCARYCVDLAAVILDLSDNHGWTREQIADWIALSEPSGFATSVDAVDPSAGIQER